MKRIKPIYDSPSVTLYQGDCLDVLLQIATESIDSVVTDPPYGLEFMGKDWDKFGGGQANGFRRQDNPADAGRDNVFGRTTRSGPEYVCTSAFQQYMTPIFAECLRVLKPGGHLLAFGGSRTYHRLACAIEDAGFEIRDQIMWIYGSGFPKSLDVSKAIDKAAGAEREIVGRRTDRAATPKQDIRGGNLMNGINGGIDCSAITAPATKAAKQWQGWGTALKPAHEPIVLARKPLIGTVAANVLQYGTGALNIDGCRVEFHGDADKAAAKPGGKATARSGNLAGQSQGGGERAEFNATQGAGRWPANVIHDGSDEVLECFPESKGQQRNDSGSAARFFYCAKASKKDRGEGNNHPTVKPTALMRYLCRLVTLPGGVVLDPFMGSGSTAIAAIIENLNCVGIEREESYCQIAIDRIERSL